MKTDTTPYEVLIDEVVLAFDNGYKDNYAAHRALEQKAIEAITQPGIVLEDVLDAHSTFLGKLRAVHVLKHLIDNPSVPFWLAAAAAESTLLLQLLAPHDLQILSVLLVRLRHDSLHKDTTRKAGWAPYFARLQKLWGTPAEWAAFMNGRGDLSIEQVFPSFRTFADPYPQTMLQICDALEGQAFYEWLKPHIIARRLGEIMGLSTQGTTHG